MIKLTIEGAKFGPFGNLDELTSKIYEDCPPIFINYKKKGESNKKEVSEDDICQCPVYKYKIRNDR